jgi:hypothetical protein
MALDEISEINEIGSPSVSLPCEMPLSPQDSAIQKVAKNHIETNLESCKSLNGRVSTYNSLEDRIQLLEEAKEELEFSNAILTKEKFNKAMPNLAFEILKLGAKKEAHIHAEINRHLEEGQRLRSQIHDLLDLSAEITKMPSDAKQLSEGAVALLKKLKESGIDLWDKFDGPISKEKLMDLKAEASSRVDRLRSDVNILLSTKVNHLTQVILPTLLEMMKKIVQEDREAKSRINERMRS